MTRWIAIFILAAVLGGCAGAGIGFAPMPYQHPSASLLNDRTDGAARVRLQMTIPRRQRHERSTMHPATISPLTQSVGISVDGGALHLFNTTPSSPSCSVVAGRVSCTFDVGAKAGTDAFLVKTFSAIHGGGAVLNEGRAVLKVVAGKKKVATIRLGPVVSTTADTGPGSLRYAVGSANAGDTILFLLPNPSTIALTKPIAIANDVSIAGPGVTTSVRRPKTTYRGITITGSGGRQIFVISSGTVSISGLILTHGSAVVAQRPGGAISNQGALSLTKDVFTNNTSTVQSTLRVRRHEPRGTRANRLRPHACVPTYFQGGAVYNNGALTVTNSTFDSNFVTSNVSGGNCQYGQGGAIYNDQLGILTVSGSLFTNNSAQNGGAVYNNAIARASFSGDTFDANLGCTANTGCVTSGCTGSGCSSYAQGTGGAIFDNDGPGIVVDNSTFNGNVVGGDSSASLGNGGALDLHAGSPQITDSIFKGNEAGGGTDNCSYGVGGAINALVPVELDNDTFSSNKAGGDGGGQGGATVAHAITGTGNGFTSNIAFATQSACSPGTLAGGGAIYANDVTLRNSAFTGNRATASGEATGGAVHVTDAVLVGDTFTSNGAATTTSGALFAYGGAVYSDDAVTLSRDTFAGNSATDKSNPAGAAVGGAVYAMNLTSNGDIFKSNAASAGSEALGGALTAGGTFVMTGDTFASNTAMASIAIAGAFSAGGPGKIIKSTFTSNVAGTGSQAGYGGAIVDNGGITIVNSVLSNNATTVAGGGLFGETGVTVTDSTISGNKVTAAVPGYGGGGIYDGAGMVVTDSTITGNTVHVTGSASGGGGFYNYAGLVMTGTLISGNSVSGSIAGSGGGGMLSSDDALISNTTIASNTSSIDGGGFEALGNNGVNLANVTLYGNKATGKGGNIENPGTIALGNTIVAGGAAASKPDFDNTGTFYDLGYNVFQQAGLATLPTDVTANPKLLPLANNGGPTLTMAELSTSPGKAHIPATASACGNESGVVTDQRNFTRGAGGKCDAGAYEYSGIPSAIRRTLPRPRGHHTVRLP